MQNELKPCPFCGAKQNEKKVPASGVVMCQNNETKSFQIMCLKCGASSDWYSTSSWAKRKWNTRTPKERGVK